MITNTPTSSIPRAISTPKSNKTGKILIDSSTSPMFKQTITVESILKQSVTEPLSQREEELATHITRRNEKGKIKFKKRGQPLTFHRVSVHQKSSNVASSPTRKRRSTIITRVRKTMSRVHRSDLEMQHASDFKRRSHGVRQNILHKSGTKERVVIDAKFALAMKETMGPTWHQYRERRRLWKKVGVCIPGEYKEREIFTKEIGDTVKLETITPVPGTSSKEEPVALVSNLNKFVMDLLEKYDGEQKLTWHNGGIPEIQIWVKIVGENGSRCSKLPASRS
ncbi:amine oxidase [Plakobranchus ocellatus]|uniref:Amine oxidase n=1 Tax=Plakobranchus ocellatus TaxID=259542 RepID=A0AAV4DWW2_9GAST|nr:amine oxidase [Plakobranchus ocellatus]